MAWISLTQKSHTLIVICEDQVIGWYELIEERGAVGRSVFVFLRSFVGIANDEIYPFKKSEDGSAFGSSIQ